MCDLGGEQELELRAAHRCTLAGFDRSLWTETPGVEAAWRAEELVAYAANQEGVTLDFDLERDGCPWGWAQCRFAAEVSTFVGTRGLDNPVRQRSLRLERRMLRDDEEPLELYHLVREAEAWEDSAYRYFQERRSRRRP